MLLDWTVRGRVCSKQVALPLTVCGLAGGKRGIRSREGDDCCIEKYYGGGQVFERAIHLDRSTGWCLLEYSDESLIRVKGTPDT